MRHLSLLLTFATAALSACSSAPTSATPTPADLVAYYPFDGDANDRSGNGFHGRTTGVALTADRFGTSRGPNVFAEHVAPARLQLRRWYHVAVTINSTTGRFCADGVPASTFQLTAPALSNPQQLVMGHSASGTSQFLVGSLDEVRLYDRAVPDAELLALCRSEAPRSHPCA
jgi:Concanavalin A-like lectin/glucanases superfamily